MANNQDINCYEKLFQDAMHSCEYLLREHDKSA